MKSVKRFSLATLAVVALAAGGAASVDGVACADDKEIVGGAIIATQNFTSDANVNDEFEYCLEAHTAGAPMPDGATGQKYCFTMKGNDKHTMQLRTDASAPDVSEYTLRLVTPLSKGYSLTSTDSYTYQVYAHRQGTKYIVLAFNDDATARVKEEDSTFSLTYKSTPTTPPPSTPPTTPPPTKPPTGNLVQTGATVSFGVMLVLLLGGGLLLSRRRAAE